MLIATAGHVDHGKTTLVRALTGVDTDRLPEEKRRGLTIDLGFAYRALDGGRTLGFVDVPGHERFVRNMIAGVPAIDFGLLIVAADDGPMPQTVEHLAILDLLGVSRGAVAVTKTDRVDSARVDEVADAVRDLLATGALAGAPLFPVAAADGRGVDALLAHLDAADAALPARATAGGFRFAVDRSFSVHGAGLVVTGAVFAGEVAVGGRLRIAGRDLEVRVRAIESAGEPVATARAGMRCALNVSGRGIDADAVTRGDWLVSEAAGEPAARIDARVRVLASERRALRQWTPVHVHHGAAFLTGRVTLLEGAPVPAGGDALVQIVLDRPTSAVHGERFVLRDTSGRRTLGGGTVIDPDAPRRVRDRSGRIVTLRALEAADAAQALAGALEHARDGIDPRRFARARNLSLDEVLALARGCGAAAPETPVGVRLVLPARLETLRSTLIDALARHHDEQPESVGPNEGELMRALPRWTSPELAAGVVAELARSGALVRDGISLRLPQHRARLSAADEKLWRAVHAHLGPEATKPPTPGDLAATLGMERPALLDFLERSARRGWLVRVAANRFYHPRALARLARAAEALAREHGEAGFDARGYRDATGIGRNLTIDVLEFFDAAGLTRRAGETRRVVRDAVAVFGAADEPAPDADTPSA